MTHSLDPKRTLDELDPPAWGEPTNDSYLVMTCHRLRTKPIGSLAIEDLRILIGQQIGLRWLIPIALDTLDADSLAEGDFYPGDLLLSVLRAPVEFWSREWEWRDRLRAVVDSMSSTPEELTRAVLRFRDVMA